MAQILIDSDVLIDHLRGKPEAVTYLRRLEANGEILCTCAIVIAEVESGLSIPQSLAVNPIIERLYVLECDVSAARQAGRWRYAYARAGIALSLPDSMIAATAYTHGATILTRNVRHYPMPELTIMRVPPRQPSR